MRREGAVGQCDDFCNDNIFNLVRCGKLSKETGMKITQALYECSALSVAFVRNLVYQGKMSMSKALATTREQYFNSALSYMYIQILVENEGMTSNRALSIRREEVANPIPYLMQLGSDKTAAQTRKLELYESDLSLTADYVERIILLEFKEGKRSESEALELSLLLDSANRKYAKRIVALMFADKKTDADKRELNLLRDPYAKSYAECITALEFRENKTVDDEINLEALYLRVCCRFPRKSFLLGLFSKAGLGQSMPQGCHLQASSGGQMAHLVYDEVSESKQIDKMKSVIEKAAKEIVLVQLDVRGVEKKTRETDSMQQYILNKTNLLRQALMKYFVGFSKAPYSKEILDHLKEKIGEQLRNKTLRLGEVDRILSLPLWIDEQERCGVLLCSC